MAYTSSGDRIEPGMMFWALPQSNWGRHIKTSHRLKPRPWIALWNDDEAGLAALPTSGTNAILASEGKHQQHCFHAALQYEVPNFQLHGIFGAQRPFRLYPTSTDHTQAFTKPCPSVTIPYSGEVDFFSTQDLAPGVFAWRMPAPDVQNLITTVQRLQITGYTPGEQSPFSLIPASHFIPRGPPPTHANAHPHIAAGGLPHHAAPAGYAVMPSQSGIPRAPAPAAYLPPPYSHSPTGVQGMPAYGQLGMPPQHVAQQYPPPAPYSHSPTGVQGMPAYVQSGMPPQYHGYLFPSGPTMPVLNTHTATSPPPSTPSQENDTEGWTTENYWFVPPS